jgi:broad specificity phosphatase PhoE
MTILLLIRHGENDYVGKRLAGRLPGVHLNERGRLQALALVPVLYRAPIKAIYSSPLERAVETAQPLAQALGLEITMAPGLHEMDSGKFAGRTIKSLARLKAWKNALANPATVSFPGGENFAQAQKRAIDELQAIVAAHPEDVVACFTHADVIRLVSAYYLQLPLEGFHRLSADTASITMIVIPKEGPAHILRLNQTVGFAWPQEKPRPPKKKA